MSIDIDGILVLSKVVAIISYFGLIYSLILLLQSVIYLRMLLANKRNGIRLIFAYSGVRKFTVRCIIHSSFIFSSLAVISNEEPNYLLYYIWCLFIVEVLTLYLNIYETFDYLKVKKIYSKRDLIN